MKSIVVNLIYSLQQRFSFLCGPVPDDPQTGTGPVVGDLCFTRFSNAFFIDPGFMQLYLVSFLRLECEK